jgi:hypothetical protein
MRVPRLIVMEKQSRGAIGLHAQYAQSCPKRVGKRMAKTALEIRVDLPFVISFETRVQSDVGGRRHAAIL